MRLAFIFAFVLAGLALLSPSCAQVNRHEEVSKNPGPGSGRTSAASSDAAEPVSEPESVSESVSEAGPVETESVETEKEKDDRLENFLRAYYKKELDAMREHPEDPGNAGGIFTYIYNKADLNGDGTPEIIVYVESSRICRPGGCQLFILQEKKGNYEVLNDLSPSHGAIYVGEQKTSGWNDIIIEVSGAGADGSSGSSGDTHCILLRSDGKKYPGDIWKPPAQPLPPGVRAKRFLGGNNEFTL
jgi:hypothetical protein